MQAFIRIWQQEIGCGVASPCRKLDPAVLVMKSAEDRSSNDVTEALGRSRQRGVLRQSEVRSNLVIVGRIGVEGAAQVALAQDDDVIETFPADRADQSLRMTVLPR